MDRSRDNFLLRKAGEEPLSPGQGSVVLRSGQQEALDTPWKHIKNSLPHLCPQHPASWWGISSFPSRLVQKQPGQIDASSLSAPPPGPEAERRQREVLLWGQEARGQLGQRIRRGRDSPERSSVLQGGTAGKKIPFPSPAKYPRFLSPPPSSPEDDDVFIGRTA